MTWTIQPRSDGPGALSYVKTGTGPALVLIHGVGLRAEAWAAIFPLMAHEFTIYAVDMPGHGASPLAGVTGLSDYVVRIAAFVDALDGLVCVAGHSMGAMIALELAEVRPDKVRAVAALNAIFRRSDAAATAIRARAKALRDRVVCDPSATLERWFGAGHKAESAACRDWLTLTDPEGYATAYRIFANYVGPLGADLKAIGQRAGFITGAQDPNSTRQWRRLWRRLHRKEAHQLSLTPRIWPR